MMILLRGGRVLNPRTGWDGLADVAIEDGRVLRVGPKAAEGLSGEGVQVFDVSGQWVLPGFVDLHTHLREPGEEHKEDIASGLAAAAAGGFTTVCAMANTRPVNDTRAVTEQMMNQARGHRVRLLPFGAVTRGLEGRQLTEMAELREAGAVGVSDDGLCVMNPEIMRRAMEYARTFDLLVTQHCEHHEMTQGAQMHEGAVSVRLGLKGWPREAEDMIVARDLLLAEQTGCRYHVAHISSLGAVRLVREAKSRGLSVSAEVTPHHLALTEEALIGYDTHCKVNPPLRTAEDRAELRAALADGTIDCVATDHAPHATIDKDCEFAAAAVGINGLETAVPFLLDLVRDGTLEPLRLAEATSAAPSRLLPDFEVGGVGEGERADVTVIDPERRWVVTAETLCSRSHNTPLLGAEVKGAVSLTIAGGQVVFERAVSESSASSAGPGRRTAS